MNINYSVRTLAVGLLLAATTTPIRATVPRMLVPVISGTRITLSLEGDPGTTYAIEASTNLLAWEPVGSGVAQAGLFSVQTSWSGSSPAIYYRGVQANMPGVFPSIVPGVSTNFIGRTLVVPDQPATLRLDAPGPVVYTLFFPTNAFNEPTLITLTALTNATGMPNQEGLLAAVRMEPEGKMPLVPLFLQIDFATNFNARQVSSFAFDNAGAGLHLIPDIVVTNATTNFVRMLVKQLRSHGCGVFTLPELQALAATIPPPGKATSGGGRRPAQTLEECYPEEQLEAKNLQGQLEALYGPVQQAQGAILGTERQQQLLGVSDEAQGAAALQGFLANENEFYETQLKPRVPNGVQKCAVAKALVPWVLGHDRQSQLLGGPGITDSGEMELLTGGLKRCKEEALACCQSHGGDTRLIDAVLGFERQAQLLGMDPDPTLTLDALVELCAPDWFGTLRIRTAGTYRNVETNGSFRITRTVSSDTVLSASVLSAKVRVYPASAFAAAYTNITCLLGGTFAASEKQEKIEEDFDLSCNGLPATSRRDVWTSSAETNLSKISVEAVIMMPGTENLFVSPYLTVSDGEPVRDMRWTWEEQQTHSGQSPDDDCVTVNQWGGTDDPKAGSYGTAIYAQQGEFTFAADKIQYSFSGPEPMRFDYEHLFNGVKEIQLDLHRVR